MRMSWANFKRAGLIAVTWLAGVHVFSDLNTYLAPFATSKSWSMAIVFVATLILTWYIWRHQSSKPALEQTAARDTQIPAQLSVRDMMALLDDNDLDDLRDEIRENLRAQIRRLSSQDDVETFEALMSESRLKRKRTNY